MKCSNLAKEQKKESNLVLDWEKSMILEIYHLNL